MSKHLSVSTILILVGPDKVTHQTRYERGVKIAAQAPQSPLYQQHADLKAAADEVVKQNTALGDLIDAYAQADAAFKKARTALGTGIVNWDGVYDVFVNTTEKYAKTPDDAASVGTQARPKTHNALLVPISVEMKDDAKKDRLVIRVHRAPGLKRTIVEVNNTDPANAAAWKELDSSGAVHYVPSPAKGTWWARAASRTAKEKSAFCAPVSIVVR
jgi:hypothetical protein